MGIGRKCPDGSILQGTRTALRRLAVHTNARSEYREIERLRFLYLTSNEPGLSRMRRKRCPGSIPLYLTGQLFRFCMKESTFLPMRHLVRSLNAPQTFTDLFASRLRSLAISPSNFQRTKRGPARRVPSSSKTT